MSLFRARHIETSQQLYGISTILPISLKDSGMSKFYVLNMKNSIYILSDSLGLFTASKQGLGTVMSLSGGCNLKSDSKFEKLNRNV